MERAEAVRLAAVDIGTNTVRLLVGDVHYASNGRKTVDSVRRVTTVTALGRGVDASRLLDAGSVRHSLAVLGEYAEISRSLLASVTVAVATSAVRDAGDGVAFLDAAGEALGTRPRVISGEEEAAITFRGVTSGLEGRGSVLVIDPGGGSTEFVFGIEDPDYSVSIDIGSVRLTERYLDRRPLQPTAIQQAIGEVQALFSSIRLPGIPGSVVGVGGTITSLAAILLDLDRYDPVAVHYSRFSATALDALIGRLGGLTMAETMAIPSLDHARAPVLLGGALVVSGALAATRTSHLLVSETDILDGLLLSANCLPPANRRWLT
jgi:exopolyphosphatase/guanosine-5'-triphosphate,3'-diphosphate pyrophosphatase